jgi:hypothetical protein
MKALQKVRVLFVSGSPEQDHLAVWLSSEGAEFHRCDWAALKEVGKRLGPSALVADLRTDRAAAEARLLQAQADPVLATVPVIALVIDAALPALGERPRVNKHITSPAHPADVINALVALGSASQVPASPVPDRADAFRMVLEAQAKRRDLRGMLALLNATGPFRYTSILRFDGDERLTSLWTFDRQDPDVDSFPTDKTVSASYCERVLETKEPFTMPDAALEPSVQDHPARHSVLSYCGVPLLRADGSVFGTICQFDVVPRFFPPTTLQRLLEAAPVLEAHLATMSTT